MTLGCSIRYCSYENAGEHVWHVLDVAENSPAEMAGVIPHTDYIIGSPHMTLRSEVDFYALVEDSLGKPLRLYLYNTEWDSCREVIIIPNHEWGGQRSLGCDVGYGLLHRISVDNQKFLPTMKTTLLNTKAVALKYFEPSENPTAHFGNVGLIAAPGHPSSSGSIIPEVESPALATDSVQVESKDIDQQGTSTSSSETPLEAMLSKQLQEAKLSEEPETNAKDKSTKND
ncbi:Golgi reassembly-stacking protein 1 [Umbelopsis nana]